MKQDTRVPLKWIVKRIKRYIPGIVAVSLIDIIIALLGVTLTFVSKEILDTHIKGTANKIWVFGAILIGISLFNIFLSSLVSIINVRVAGKITISMRNYMFSSLVHKK